tara:strand:- start:3135 stop:3698 length:564 start_codon:yes stop_codon:yes gene_type:complete
MGKRWPDDGIHTYSVQEAAHSNIPRLIKVVPTIVADDNADNDVCFNWIEIPKASLVKGRAIKLVSASIYDPGVALGNIELYFARGSGDSGTAPTTAQNLQDGAAGSAVVDITAAEGTAIAVCGSVLLSYDDTVGLVLAGVLTATNINLIMAPASDSTSLYVGGVYRSNPADNSGGNTTMDVYLGFEG